MDIFTNLRVDINELDATPGINVGEQFDAVFIFTDIRNDIPQSVFTGFADVEFDPTKFQALGITYNEALFGGAIPHYQNLQTGTIDNGLGIVDEVGAASTQLSGLTFPDAFPVFTIRFEAIGGGTGTISTNAGEDATSQVTLYGRDFSPDDLVDFGSVDVTVAGNDDPFADDDSASTNEDTPVSINVVDGDTDSDGTIDPTTVTVISGPDNGEVTVNDDGTVDYTPDADYNGSDSFTYTVQDNEGGTSNEATVNVTVAPVDDPAVAVDDSASTLEDTAVNIDVLANDSDIDSPLTLESASGGTNGTVVIEADNTVTYTPDADFNGSDSFSYTVNGETANVDVTVAPVDDPAVAVDDSASTLEDTAVNIDVLANDSDIDSPLTLESASGGTNGTVVIEADNTVTYTPDPGFNGPDSFTYTVNGETAAVDINVTNVDTPTTAVDDTATVDEDSSVNIDVLANDSDPDSPLTVGAVGDAANGVVVIEADNTVTYTPDADFNGSDSFSYTVNGETANVDVTVAPVDDPAVAVDDSASTLEDTAVNIDVLANDSDIDSPLTLESASGGTNGTVVIEADNTVTYTPDPGFNGPDSFTYTVNGETAAVDINVTNVDTPTTAVDDTATVDEDSSVNIDVLANDSDPDSPLTVGAVGDAANGVVVIEADNTVTYTPDADFNGSDSFSYTVNGETANVDVTVAPVDDPAVAVDDSASTLEDTAVNIDVLANDSDIDSPLTLESASGGTNGTVVIEADNTVTYTPDPGFNGPDSFTYTVNGETAAVDINVTNVDTPTTAVDDTATVDEDSSVNIDVLANDSDPDSPLTVGAVGDAANGVVVIEADNTVTYTPDADFNGSDSFSYTVNGETANVDVTVAPVDDPAVAVDDSASTLEDTAVNIDVLANDSDIDSPLTLESASGGTNGTVVIEADNTVTYTPDPGFNGPDSFTYTVNGETAAVDINVTNVDTPTTAVDDTATVDEDSSVNIDVLANDSDPDSPLTVGAVGDAANGVVVIEADNTVTYTPDADFNGSDSFSYTVNGETANVDVTVAPVDDDPVADDDAAILDEDTSANINVIDGDTDIDGTIDPTSVTVTSGPSNGNVSVNADGTVDYTPDADYNGGDSFTYTVQDNEGGTSNEATVVLDIQPKNDNPVAADSSFTGVEDNLITGNVLDNDDDVDGDSLSASLLESPSNGNLTLNSDGSFEYTPNADFNGTDTFTYQASDGNGGTDDATVALTVEPEDIGTDDVSIDVVKSDAGDNDFLVLQGLGELNLEFSITSPGTGTSSSRELVAISQVGTQESTSVLFTLGEASGLPIGLDLSGLLANTELDENSFLFGLRDPEEGTIAPLELEGVNDDGFILSGAGIEFLATTVSAPDPSFITEISGLDVDALIGTVGGEKFSLEFTLHREAAFDNFIGFYAVDALTGAVLDGGGNAVAYADDRAMYLQAALDNTLIELVAPEDGGSAQIMGSLDFSSNGLGSINVDILPYLIVDGLPDNVEADFKNVYTALPELNLDSLDHFRTLGSNAFGVEDLFGGGDNDFDDLVLQVALNPTGV